MNTVLSEIISEIKIIIHGKDTVIEQALCTILAGGHVLLEDIPGVGKTTLAMALAGTMSLSHKRIQFTPDVLASDLIGFNMFDRYSGDFRFVEGSVYTNLLLADEINRTSPKTQSALLEVMEERKVTVDGVTRMLPNPFFVIATQNPFGASGTQKLPESQLDRFMVRLSMGYPDRDGAIAVLKGNSAKSISMMSPVCSLADVLTMQQQTEQITVDDSLYDYIARLAEATRNPERFSLGLSPRGSIALLKMAKAHAFYCGRSYVIPDDIHDIILPVVCHRLVLSAGSRAAGLTVHSLVESLLKEVPVPKVTDASRVRS